MNAPSWRKPAGVLAMLVLIVLWGMLIASAADIVGTFPWPVQAVFYAVTGVIWILPLKPLLRWMETGHFR